jgi:hypothetical protein
MARGQLSAEMIILLAVVIAVVAMAAMYMMNTAKNAGATIENTSGSVLNRTQQYAANFSAAVPPAPQGAVALSIAG